MHYISKTEIKHKTILLRLDLNLPSKNGLIIDDTRVCLHLPTIKYLLENGNKIIIISHFGRPKGMTGDFSLSIVKPILERYLDQSLLFITSKDFVEIKKTLEENPHQIAMLENIRLFDGETENSKELAENLANLTKQEDGIYVNDAFSASHREHASVCAITKFLPSYAGLLMEEEVKTLSRLLKNPTKHSLAIIGGSKISTKLPLIKSLIGRFDKIFIGGAMANSFLKAKNIQIGRSFYEPDYLQEALECLKLAEDRILLPIDFSCLDKNLSHKFTKNVDDSDIIYDLGPETLELLKKELDTKKTIIWNGPVGVYEMPPFDFGCDFLAKYIANLCASGNCGAVLAGGDTVASLKNINKQDFTYVSPSGGAFLEWLEKGTLPGICELG